MFIHCQSQTKIILLPFQALLKNFSIFYKRMKKKTFSLLIQLNSKIEHHGVMDNERDNNQEIFFTGCLFSWCFFVCFFFPQNFPSPRLQQFLLFFDACDVKKNKILFKGRVKIFLPIILIS